MGPFAFVKIHKKMLLPLGSLFFVFVLVKGEHHDQP